MLSGLRRSPPPRIQFYGLVAFSLLITAFAGWINFTLTYRNHAQVSASLNRMNAVIDKLSTINELAQKIEGEIIGQALHERPAARENLLLLDEASKKLYELLEEREGYLSDTRTAFESFYLFSKRMIHEPPSTTIEEHAAASNILIARANALFSALRELRTRERLITKAELDRLRGESERNALLSTTTIALAAFVIMLCAIGLLRSYAATRRLLDALPFPAMILDERNRVLSQNETSQRMGAKLGHTYSMPEQLEDTRADGRISVEFTRDGAVLEATVEPLGPKLRLLYLIDITERKKLEKSVMEAEKREALGNLAGGFAHDFNNLLMVIMGNVEYALRKLESPLLIRGPLEGSMEASRNASLIVRKVMAYTEKYLGPKVKLDPGEIVSEVFLAAKAKAGGRVEMHLSSAPEPRQIFGGQEQMRTIVESLLSNALHAVRQTPGPKVEVRLSSSVSQDGAASVLLEVEDNGEGMPDEVRRQMFDPYFTTREDCLHGRGLGLAATLGLVKMMRGEITVWSEPGTGTLVTVIFPAI